MNKNEAKIERTDFLNLSVIENNCIRHVKQQNGIYNEDNINILNGRFRARLNGGAPRCRLRHRGAPAINKRLCIHLNFNRLTQFQPI